MVGEGGPGEQRHSTQDAPGQHALILYCGLTPSASSMPARYAIVVPCYNESARLPTATFEKFLDGGQTRPFFIFVDDGSRDQTLAVLERIRKGREDRVTVLALKPNGGKAEAVRAGMNHAFDGDFV